MQQLDLFEQITEQREIPEEISTKERGFSWVQEEVKNKTTQLIDKSYQYSFRKGSITSYKVDVEQGNIKKVLFHVWKESFQVFLKYDYESKNIVQVNYTETDPDERERIVKSIQIKNLKIEGLQKKVQVGYWEWKQSANYFKHLWLDTYWLTVFLEELIKKFHTWT